MVKNKKTNRDNTVWWLIIVAIIVGFFLYIVSKLRVQKANDELREHLKERSEALNSIYIRRGYYRKEKIEILYAKRQTTIFLRFFVSVILLVLNGLYIVNCYPDNIRLQEIFECIATFNAGLLFMIGIITFAAFGSFFEIKAVYRSFQAVALAWLFKEKEETIDSILKLDLENSEAIRKEIAETEEAIKHNEELLNVDLNSKESKAESAI